MPRLQARCSFSTNPTTQSRYSIPHRKNCVATIPTGSGQHEVAVSPDRRTVVVWLRGNELPDQRRKWATNRGGNTVSIIDVAVFDAASRREVRRIKMQSDASSQEPVPVAILVWPSCRGRSLRIFFCAAIRDERPTSFAHATGGDARVHCASSMKTIGVISDTHGLLRLEAEAALASVDHIIHAGDIGAPEILERLRRIAPVTAVRGNNDKGEWANPLPDTAIVDICGQRLYVVHDIAHLDVDPVADGIAAIIAGHSHKPAVIERDGVLFLNPGSAGPRRFTLPVAIARLFVGDGAVRAEICNLRIASPAARVQ
jgi:putative phosphoesterase